MDSSRVSRRLDGRCLFPQRCFSSSPPDRVPTCVLELLEREKLSQSSAALYGKRILLGCRDCGVYPHTDHALDHFWRNISLRHLQRTGLGLDRALVAWNAGFIFQWGAHLIPARGPVSFSEVARNQFFVVPRQLSAQLRAYLFRRKALMQQIEDRDIQQLQKNPPAP